VALDLDEEPKSLGIDGIDGHARPILSRNARHAQFSRSQKTYTEVSTEQDKDFIFPTGRA
jgi:hypothetical protein